MEDESTRRIEELVGSRTLVAHTCNPSYLGGQDLEDHNLKPAQTNRS
jgi:serine protease inhibitor ecotin